jgi:hypothetical protein
VAVQPSSSRPGQDSWHLPQVHDVQVKHVRYSQPKYRARGLELVPFREAVEILVTTAGPFPVRAYSPALFVGEAPVIEYEVAGENRYRFLVFDFRGLAEGAPISLGWPQVPEKKVRTKFRYELGGPLVS